MAEFTLFLTGCAGWIMDLHMRKRLDFYVEDALRAFAEWYISTDWLGKERDCVNRFVTGFLYAGIDPEAAIRDPGEVRIECGVPVPREAERRFITKDLVIWRDALETTWNDRWEPIHVPRAILEWKTYRSGSEPASFDSHDEEWLTEFTAEYPKCLGYLVSTYAARDGRSCIWAKVKSGAVGRTTRVSFMGSG